MGNSSKIIAGFKNNNAAILKQVYLNVYPKVSAYVHKNNGSEDQAKDIYQEAFVSCWKNVKEDRLSSTANIEAYLFTIAKNKWVDYLRSTTYKRNKGNIAATDLKTVTDDVPNDESHEANLNAMNTALKRLGASCKTLLRLFYFERRSMDQIAVELKMTAASARNQKYRCMQKLRTLSLELRKNG